MYNAFLNNNLFFVQVFPFCYILMTRRTTACYSAVFQYIEKNIFKLEPVEFITDFETGMRSAISNCYPTATLRGCWYHYTAAIRKKMLKLGLHKLLKTDDDAKKIKKMLMSLPLLPHGNFMEGYGYIKECAKEWKILNKFKTFFAYFEKQWVSQVF